MNPDEDARQFLRTRRARITPEQAGLPVNDDRRRVPGLRREEVARIAGISPDAYRRMERGDLSRSSGEVLEAVADALHLGPDERAILRTLSRIAPASARASQLQPRKRVPPKLRWVLDGVGHAAAHVLNPRTDIVAANALGQALFYPVHSLATPPNLASFVFLHPGASEFFGDWDAVAQECAASLVSVHRRSPGSRGLSDLVSQLSENSRHFRRLWEAEPAPRRTATLHRFHHPVVGTVALSRESMELRGQPDLRLDAYSAEPGTPSARALDLLARRAPLGSGRALQRVVVPTPAGPRRLPGDGGSNRP